jgi:hypothetical protein
MNILSNRLPIIAATSLASLSLSEGGELRKIASDSIPNATTEQTKSPHKLGSFAGTNFYLQTEGVRKYLVAENQGDVARTLCQSTNTGQFSVTELKGATGVFIVTCGPDRYGYTPFGGGSLIKL